MAEVVVLGPEHDDRVRALLRDFPQATIYHTPAWRDAVTATYGYQPMNLGYLEGTELRAVLPLMFVRSRLTGRRLVSVPFSNTCGPVGRPEGVGPLVDKALAMRRDLGAKALEIRTQSNLNPIDDERFTKLSYFITSVLALDPDPMKVWDGFKGKNVRTEVRQATKKGIEVREGTREDLEQFYRLFANLRLKHGVPPQPFGFFDNLWRHLWPDHLHLLVATYRGKHVASMLNLGYGQTIAGAYLGSDLAYRSYRVHQLLYWKTMELGCLKGYRFFDFLRSPKNDEGLRYFKHRWSAVEVDLQYLFHPQVCGTASTVEESAKYKLMAAVLKRAPKFVGKGLGRMIYGHLG
jgi:CelD/BcsL family acetyltransferase involved in cellulose biosynthesis